MNTMLTPFNALDALFDRFASPMSSTESGSEGVVFRPKVDIHESETEYLIEADLPGVRKEDLKVEIEKNRLTIHASRSQSEVKHQPIHIERMTSATFARSFSLGNDVEPDRIQASFEDGVLRLELPKLEKALPKRIEVK